MLTVYHSNQLDLLKSLTAELMKRQPLDSVFAPEVILVQSNGMGQWLQIELAEELNISANIDYLFPAQFVWDIYRIFLPDLPKHNRFNADFMTWVLLAKLPELCNSKQLPSLEHYFSQADEQKQYQFATSVASLFDHYVIYRPDWVTSWEQNQLLPELNETQQWQAKLWQVMQDYTESLPTFLPNQAGIHQKVMAQLISGKITADQISQLPKRIFVYGVVNLPPIYLQLFHALSQYIDVHLMFMNPCRYYWGDIVDTKHIKNYAGQAQALQADINPLLLSWGKLGRDYLAILQQYEDKRDIEAFIDFEQTHVLAKVQQSVLELQQNAKALQNITAIDSKYKQPICNNDDSISIHACHSEQREVEVVYDYLLDVLQNNPDININDCVVMVADIDHYAPYIQAVFDNAPKDRYLPYTISDQTLRKIEPIVQGFLLLLTLPDRKLEIDFIFDLLDIPAITKRFAIDNTKLKQLQRWVIQAGIRWGFDSEVDKPHSWLVGLKRMLLGYVMKSNNHCWQDILPYDEITGLEAEQIGLLADFIMALANWHQKLSQHYPIHEWKIICNELLQSFFVEDSASQPLLLMIQQQWQNIIEQASLANYQQQISITILRNIIQSKLENNRISNRFLIGKVNFCTLMPMRSVPFKVVCLLGMNDGVYPRISLPLSFDLINQYRRIGDRSRRNDDRYLFLEAILSAQQKLYISYIGRDIQTNDTRYPSILVDELLDFLQDNFVLKGDEALLPQNSAENLLDYLVFEHARMPFNPDNFMSHNKACNLISYANEWLPAAKKEGITQSFLSHLDNVTIENVTLDDLKRFYLHPIREITKKRLGYALNQMDEQLPEAENFNLDNLQLYHINNEILDNLLSQNSDANISLYHKLLRSNKLPYAAFGEIIYEQQHTMMQNLADKIKQEKQADFSKIDINLNINGVNLSGCLSNIQPDGILDFRSAQLTIRDGFKLWIDHLIYCATQPNAMDCESRIFGRDESEWRFAPLEATEALSLLTELVENYQKGLNEPFFMPIISTWKWLETVFEKEANNITHNMSIHEKANNNFMRSWQGGYKVTAECDDYYSRYYPELTTTLLQSAVDATIKYLLPVMQYRRK
ncbi:exodeoxyribonuclease V subunit gamma [Orbaceae bacterium ac157xtp]